MKGNGRVRGRLSVVLALVLLIQLAFPTAGAFASEDSTLLPPSNLSRQDVSPDDIKLTWTAVFGATGYKVYQITEGQLTPIGTTAATSFTIHNLPEGDYTYVVSTLSAAGESGPCAPLTVTIVYPDMAAPSISHSIANGNDIVLNWSASAHAESYKVYRIGADGSPALIGTVAARSYTMANSAEDSYSFAVSAVNSVFGESPLSAPVAFTLTFPQMAAPANASISLKNVNDIVLSWSAVSYAAGYNVYQVVDGQKQLKGRVAGTTVTYANQPAGDYVYEIHAVSDRFGESAEGSELSITVGDVVMTPPTNLAVKLQNLNDVVLTWTAAANATGYNVYQVSDGQRLLKGTVAATTVTYANHPAGDFTYEVTSVSSRFGESAESASVNVTVGAVVMEPPGSLSHKLQNGNDIVLTWAAAANANSYKVYQIVNGQKTLKSSIAGTTVTYANQPAGDYAFEVHSFSTKYGESAQGAVVQLTLTLPVMQPPANLRQTIKNATDFSLSWEASSYASNYRVYQIVDGKKVLKNTVTTLTVNYTGMKPGEYSYAVHSYSARFGESPEGALLTFTMDGQVLDAPGNPSYSVANGNDIVLKWASVPYATQYKVYQVIDGEKVLKSTLTGLTVTYANQPEGSYEFVVHSNSALLGESPEGTAISLTLVHPKLAAPGSPSYRLLNGNDVALSWGAVTYANSYNVYEVVNGANVFVRNVTSLSTTLTNVSFGEHQYRITGIGARFGESPTAAAISVPVPEIVMQAPGGLVQTIANGNDITLKWNAVTYATGYKIYQVIDGEEVLKKTQTGTSVTFAKQADGVYTYVVYAYSDRFGVSTGSRLTFELSTSVMDAPGGLSHTIANGNDVTLKWSAATYATAYRIYRVEDGQKVLVRTQTSTSYSMANHPEGSYTYVVHSYSDRFGESPEGSEIIVDVDFPVMQPPAGLTQSVANGNDVTLRWSSATYASGYKVYRIDNGEKVLVKTQTGTSISLVNHAEGTFTYVVHSYNTQFGDSPGGSSIEFTMVWPTVQPPVVSASVFNANNLTLTWKAAAWANEYRVYKLANGSRSLVYKGTALKANIYNLTEDTHHFEVTAYNTRFGESEPSNRITETIVFPVMQPPVASITLLSGTSARIYWNFVTYANGYNLYELIDGEPVPVAKNINNLSYTLNDLTYRNHLYYITSVSNSFGESEPSNQVIAKLIVDMEPPVTTSDAPDGWVNRAVTVNLNAADNETGVDVTRYSLNGGEEKIGTTVEIAEAGVNTLAFYSIDKVGNRESVKTVQIRIDTTAPATKAEAPADWVRQATVKLSASDELSGAAATYYSVDGADYVQGTEVTIIEEGEHEIGYYSVDEAGNREQAGSAKVKVDRTAPLTIADATDTWTAEDVTVKLSADDGGSGVAATYYAVDGQDFTEGNAVTVRTEGVHTVAFYSVDAAGNKETAKTQQVRIDRTAPQLKLDLDELYQLGSAVRPEFAATDALSGVQDLTLTVTRPDGKRELVAKGGAVTVNQPGVYTFTLEAVDQAGNRVGVTKKLTAYVKATISVTPNVIKGNKGVFTVRVDLPAGFSTQGFDLNTAAVNGVSALRDNNGYYNQAKNGQFKFERADFSWTGTEVTLKFKGMANGVLVMGETTVKVQN